MQSTYDVLTTSVSFQPDFINEPRYRSLPWPSFTNVTHLNVNIKISVLLDSSDQTMMRWLLVSHDAFRLLQEAAQLATIETLTLECFVNATLADDSVAHEALSDICSHHLNNHFYGNNFPFLKTITLSVWMYSASSRVDDQTEAFEAVIKDYLPSIFGSEGRVAMHGLNAKVYTDLGAKEEVRVHFSSSSCTDTNLVVRNMFSNIWMMTMTSR